ncbi:MAG: hypothetical protein WC445_04900 [Patescibacteria group bacterium]
MKFYIMERGIWEKISASERRDHATFFAAGNKRSLNSRVKVFSGKYANDTKIRRLEKILAASEKKLRIKVCGPVIFFGRPVGIEQIGGNNWDRKGDSYLKTEIVPGKLYCYSWVANSSDKNPICVSFEILKEKKKKK